MKTRILLVDDHPVFLQGIIAILGNVEGIEVVGQAQDGEEAIQKVKKLKPDMVVMDITMPQLDGIAATKQILKDSKDTMVLALSIHSGKRFVKEMLKAGAKGYLLKDSAPEELVNAIHKIAEGHMYLSPSITSIALEQDDDKPEDIHAGILFTKFHRPPVSNDLLFREKIIEELETNIENPLTLVSAPAGYGKSVTISQWLEKTKSLFAWISLDDEHDDLRIFLSYFLVAIEKIFPGKLDKTTSILQASELPPMKVMTTSLINDLDTIQQNFILVLDDFHKIHKTEILDIVNELLLYPPNCLHLVIITRRDPALKLGSLKLHNRMTEIRMKKLAFSEQEIEQLFQIIHKTDLKKETVRSLQEKTEGWIVGLRLALMAVDDKNSIDKILVNFKGDLYAVSEFILEEVLLRQTAEIQDNLIIASILDRFCSEIIDVISNVQADKTIRGNEFIKWLTESNMFVIALDNHHEWFRYHHLFRELLQKQLRKKKSDKEIVVLHELASNWFEKKLFIEDAIKHALFAKNPDLAADIMEKHRSYALNADKWGILEHWLSLLPSEIVEQRVTLLMAYAWVHKQRFRLSEMINYLGKAKALLGETPEETVVYGEWCFLTGWLKSFMEDDPETNLKLLKKSLKLIPAKPVGMIRAEAELQTAIATQMAGKGEEALQKINKQIADNLLEEGLLWERIFFGVQTIHILRGNLPQTYREATIYNAYSCCKHVNPFLEGWSCWFLGTTSLHMGNMEEAKKQFQRVIELQYSTYDRASIDSMVGLALSYQFLGDPNKADHTIAKAFEYAEWTKDPSHPVILNACKARLAILRNDKPAALDWLKSYELPPHVPSMVFFLANPVLTECKVLISYGNLDDGEKALDKLETCLKVADKINYTCQSIEIKVLKVMALNKLGQKEKALETLEELIRITESGKWIRPFIESGTGMMDLLNQLVSKNIANDYINTILSRFNTIEASANKPNIVSDIQEVTPSISKFKTAEQVSHRESEILELVASGFRNKEIGAKLYISENTVKKHLFNIFQKFGVKNRISLIEKAKEAGVLER